MPLSPEEQLQLDELQRKAEEPEPGPGRAESIAYTVDLSDPDAVERAVDLGLLTRSEADDLDDDPDPDDDPGDDPGDDPPAKGAAKKKPAAKREPKKDNPPKRGGFFGDK